jgi:exonuclease III
MKILVWNVRGLNNPFKQREIRKMLRRLKISLFCLVETRVKFDKADAIKEFLVPGWDWFHNYSTHYILDLLGSECSFYIFDFYS